MAETTMTFGGTTGPLVPSADALRPKRKVGRALGRGLRCRCPNCGEGRLFNRYLKVVPACQSCGEDLSHQRADDAPPYITIVVVGHILVPLILEVETHWTLPTWVHLAVWLPLTLILSLALLQPIKGMVVGLQWALYMHGFDPLRGNSDDGQPIYILPGTPEAEAMTRPVS